jgi:hypothetical protein
VGAALGGARRRCAWKSSPDFADSSVANVSRGEVWVGVVRGSQRRDQRSEIRRDGAGRWALTQGTSSCGSEIRRLEAGNGDQRPTQLAPSCLLPTWPSNRRLTGAHRRGHGGETLAASNHCRCWRALAALPCILLRPPVAVQCLAAVPGFEAGAPTTARDGARLHTSAVRWHPEAGLPSATSDRTHSVP